MRMTLHTDYALRVLIYLALRPECVCITSEMARAYGLSRNHLMKVVLTLRNIGLIETVRGRSGGIRLAKAPDQINVGTVIRQVEQDFSLVECMEPTGGLCAITPSCQLKRMLSNAIAAYLAVLDQYTLADIARYKTALRSLLAIDSGISGTRRGRATAGGIEVRRQ